MKRTQNSKLLPTLMAFVAMVAFFPWLVSAGSLEPPASAVDGYGNPVPTAMTPPSWSQKLPADDGNPATGCGSSRFDCVMGGAAVLDKETGLVWERSPDGTAQRFNTFYCYEKTVGGRRGWRLPSVSELVSLIDPTRGSPGLPSGHPFTNVKSNLYWAHAGESDYDSRMSKQVYVFFTDTLGEIGEVRAYSWGWDSNPPLNYIWCVRSQNTRSYFDLFR